MEDKVKTFSFWLKASGMSVRSLAEVLGVSRASVYKWLSGEMLPTATNLVKLEALSGGVVTARSFTRQPQGGKNDNEM
jgi:transcriptional regulator with XRE-family HTH domain